MWLYKGTPLAGDPGSCPESFGSGMSNQDQSHYQKRISAERCNPIPTKLVYTHKYPLARHTESYVFYL